MKNFIKFFFIGVLLTSCSSEENTTITSENLTLELAIEKVTNESINSEKSIEFSISIDKSGNVQLGEAQIVSKDRFKEDFITAWNLNKTYNISQNKQQRSTTICCNVGGEQDDDCDTCRDDDANCIVVAIRNCIDDEGGCAEVCENKIRYFPSSNTYTLSK